MKLLCLICLSLLTVFTIKAYTFDDSTKAKHNNIELTKTINIQAADSALVNKNDRKDVFIDNDGDGICDKRVRGMSFSRSDQFWEKYRKRHRGKFYLKNNRGYRNGKK